MILQRLAEHYDRIVAEGKAELAPPGKSVQKISFAIVLHPDGTLHSFADEREGDGKKQRALSAIVPGQGKPSGSGLNPGLLWDNAEYLLGWSADPARRQRAVSAFEALRARHLALEATLNDAAFSAVCNFLRSWHPEQASAHAERLLEIATNFGAFRIVNERKYVHDVVALPEMADEEAAAALHCLVSGETAPVARLHEPKIKGVNGAQTAGALLVSFNASAFESYGRSQSYNAPVSQSVTFRYTNALNHLLDGRQKRRINLGDATIVYWADCSSPLEDALGGLFSSLPDDPPKEERERVEAAERLLKQLRDGIRSSDDKEEAEPTARFFILGLSPNASRLSVRLWVEEDASELRKKLAEHLQDLALKGGRDDRMLAVWQMVQATGRAERDKGTGRVKSYDTKATSPQLAGEIARSILTGAPYPQALLATMVRRIRSDGDVGWARVSAIKAVLVRNARTRRKALEQHAAPAADTSSEMAMELNEQNNSLAYRCGRIFAVLERAQEQSVTQDNTTAKLNATIKDRFFGAAAATPLLVLPRLLVLNNHHTRKLREGSKRYLNGLLGSIMETQPFAFPRQLTLEQQGEFIVGYFQQRQDFYKPKAEQDKDSAPQEAETTA